MELLSLATRSTFGDDATVPQQEPKRLLGPLAPSSAHADLHAPDAQVPAADPND